MATYYGDGIAVSDSVFNPSYTRNVAKHGARLRVAQSRITRLLVTASSDVARMISLPSIARLWQLYFYTNAAAAAGATDIGLYRGGSNQDGALIDIDFFATAVTVTGGTHTYADIFAERAASVNVNRGLPLWQAAGLTSDPGGELVIALTPSTTFTTTAPICDLTAFFTLGD